MPKCDQKMQGQKWPKEKGTTFGNSLSIPLSFPLPLSYYVIISFFLISIFNVFTNMLINSEFSCTNSTYQYTKQYSTLGSRHSESLTLQVKALPLSLVDFKCFFVLPPSFLSPSSPCSPPGLQCPIHVTDIHRHTNILQWYFWIFLF